MRMPLQAGLGGVARLVEWDKGGDRNRLRTSLVGRRRWMVDWDGAELMMICERVTRRRGCGLSDAFLNLIVYVSIYLLYWLYIVEQQRRVPAF